MNTKRFILRDWSIRDSLKTYLDTLEIDGERPLEVIIRRYRKNRSLAQNNLMWMWLTLITRHLDDEHGIRTRPEDLKEEFQYRWLPITSYMRSDGIPSTRVRGTSELNTGEFTEFLNRIEVYANSELGLNLPHPEDLFYEAMGRAA